jgi:Family of unknown function (DUF6603)
MAAFDVALVELGHLLGLFKANDSMDWEWFGDPLGRSLASMPAERERIGALIRALLERSSTTGAFDGNANWEPILDTNNVGLGPTWTKTGALQIGLGAKANVPIGGQQITLAALARLLQIDGTVTPRLGEVTFAGTFPVPDFLTGGEINGEVGTAANKVGLKASTQNDSRQLDYPDTPVIAWDIVRLAVFVLRAWIAQRAAANEEFFKRVNDHVFPMMGDPAGPIDPFPLVGAMKSPADFDAWRETVLTTDNNAAGALTFLWHLRALLTGNEDPNFLSGSYFFPLSGAPQAGSPPPNETASGTYTRPTGTTGAWVGLLTDPANTFSLVLDLETAAPAPVAVCRITLAQFDANTNTFSRPSLDASWQGIAQFIKNNGLQIGQELLTAVEDGPAFRLSLLRTTVAGSPLAGFNGDYDLAIRLEAGQPPAFVLGTPALNIAFPPEANDLEQLLGDIVVWALKAAAPGDDLGQLITTAADFVKDAVTGGSPDAFNLLTKVAAVAGQGQEIEVELASDAALSLEVNNGKLLTSVEFGPIEVEALQFSIGTVKGGVTINPAAPTVVDGFTLGFENLRLSDENGGSGIVAELIPDMRQMPGFKLALTYTPPNLVKVEGGGKVPIQRTIGPLEIAALLIDIREESFAIGLDLGFELGPIAVAAYELGLRIHFDDGAVEPFLHGLGLSMDTGVVKLAGFFAAVESNGVTDYVGGAVVSVAGYFELSAIGGYTQIQNGPASLFIFASLVAPLGGPPWFFITGVAGGFGFNRSLPAPGLLLDHPFLKVMRGEISVGTGNAAEDLKGLSVHFAAMAGQHWIAAGIQFTAFGFIYGKVVVAIAFGNKFSIQILGMASFGIEPICYFEIGIEVTADEEKFIMRARLSPNSYVVHPDIFSLQGDFALCAWYKEPHKGDFLFSIGGYHPLFAKPEHYPELIRVGCKAVVYNFVHISVEVFFCCTPQALMAGAKASLWAEFAGIEAGLDVYVDVLMKWDPFFLRARLGVHIWFVFFGRHEIGVDLDIWTPEFGGIATIDLALVEFDVEFGASLDAPPPPPLFEFIGKQLGVPAKSWNGGARTAAFSTETEAGLFRVEFLTGRPGKEPPPKDEKQEGLDAANPVLLSAEWSFLVRTRLPLGKLDTAVPPNPAISGEVDIPLCTGSQSNWLDRPSMLTVSAPRVNLTKRSWVADYFPAANFGDPVPEAQVKERDSVSKLKTDKPSIALIEGMIVDYAPQIPIPPDLTAPTGEPSDPNESYPIPLGASGSGVSLGSIKVPFVFGDMSSLPVTFSSGVSRRDAALADLRSWRRPGFTVLLQAAEVQRFTRLSAGLVTTVGQTGTAGVVLMSPPVSPARPAEMFDVQLRTLPVRSNQPVQRRQMETRTKPRTFKETVLTKAASDRVQAAFSVAAGRVSQVALGGGVAREGLLRLSGDQTTRTIVFDRGGAVVLDTYTRGTSALKLPRGAARALVIGEGVATAPTTLGIERESIVLAVGSRQFAGHGCVASVSSYFDLDVNPMDSLPGAELFEHAATLRVSFANAAREEGAFILKLTPAVERPGPAAEQVRWMGEGAQLRSMTPVVAAGRVALVMSVRAPAPWSVTVDVGPEWRLDGIVFVPRAARLVIADLLRDSNWDLVDDSMPVHPRTLATSVSLEATA